MSSAAAERSAAAAKRRSGRAALEDEPQQTQPAAAAAAASTVSTASAAPAAAAFALGLKPPSNNAAGAAAVSPSNASAGNPHPRSPSPSSGGGTGSGGGDSYTRHLHDTIRELQAKVAALSKDNVIKSERIALQEEQLRDKQAALTRQDGLYRALFASLLVSQFVKSWKCKRTLFRLQDLLFNLLPFVLAEYDRAPSAGTTFDTYDSRLRSPNADAASAAAAGKESARGANAAALKEKERAAAAARRAAAEKARKDEEEAEQHVSQVAFATAAATTATSASDAQTSLDSSSTGRTNLAGSIPVSPTASFPSSELRTQHQHSGGSLHGVVALKRLDTSSPNMAGGRDLVSPTAPTSRRARAKLEEQRAAQTRHLQMDITSADVARMHKLRRVRKGERLIQTPLIQFTLYLEDAFSLVQQAVIALLQRLPAMRAETEGLAERNIGLQAELRDAVETHASEKAQLASIKKELTQLQYDHARLRSSYTTLKERLSGKGVPASQRLGRETRISSMATQYLSRPDPLQPVAPQHRRPGSRSASQTGSRAASAGRSRSVSPAAAAGVGAAARRSQLPSSSASIAGDDETDFLFPPKHNSRPTSAASSRLAHSHSAASSLKKSQQRPSSAAVARSSSVAAREEHKDSSTQPHSRVSSSRRQHQPAQLTSALDALLSDDDEADAAKLNPRTAGRERSRYVRRSPTLSPQTGHPVARAPWNTRSTTSMREESPGRPTRSFTSHKRYDLGDIGGTNLLLGQSTAAIDEYAVTDPDTLARARERTHDVYANATQHAQAELARLRPGSSPSRQRKLQASTSAGRLPERSDFQSRVETEAEARAGRMIDLVGQPRREKLQAEYMVDEPADHGGDPAVENEHAGAVGADSDLEGFATSANLRHPHGSASGSTGRLSSTRSGRTQNHYAQVSYLRPSELLAALNGGSGAARRSDPRSRSRKGPSSNRSRVDRTLDFQAAEDEDLSELIVGGSETPFAFQSPHAFAVHIATKTVDTRSSPLATSPKKLTSSQSAASLAPARRSISATRDGTSGAPKLWPANGSANGMRSPPPVRIRSDVHAEHLAAVRQEKQQQSRPQSPATRSRPGTGARSRGQSASRKKRPASGAASAARPPPSNATELLVDSFAAQSSPASADPPQKDLASILAGASDYDSYIAEIEANSPKKSHDPLPRPQDVEPIATQPPFSLSPEPAAAGTGRRGSVLSPTEQEKIRVVEAMHAERRAARARIAALEAERIRLAELSRAAQEKVDGLRAASSAASESPSAAESVPSLSRTASSASSSSSSSRPPVGSAAAAVAGLASASAAAAAAGNEFAEAEEAQADAAGNP